MVAALRPVAVVAACAALLGGCAFGEPLTTNGITQTGATLRGNVYSSFHGNTEYWWDYGGTPGYGQSTPHRTIAIDDEDPHPVSEPVTGLSPNTIHHFRLCARDAEESPPRTNCSKDGIFSTASAIGGSRIVYASDFNDPGGAEVFVMDPDGGNKQNLTENAGSDFDPDWSPDRSKIAFRSARGPNADDVYVMDADGSDQTRLTDDPANDFDPVWSPDGSKIAFTSVRSGDAEIYVMDADGSDETRLTNRADSAFSPAWSPDGTRIAFVSGASPSYDIHVMDADGSDQVNVTESPTREADPAWSPDGSRIVFTRDEKIWVMGPDGSHAAALTDVPGSEIQPAWSPDGRKITFAALRDGRPYQEIYVMDADGSDPVNVTNSEAPEFGPNWSSVP